MLAVIRSFSDTQTPAKLRDQMAFIPLVPEEYAQDLAPNISKFFKLFLMASESVFNTLDISKASGKVWHQVLTELPS